MSVGVTLDKPKPEYAVGEIISGIVHVHLEKAKKIRKVAVDIKGKEKTRWLSRYSKARDSKTGSQEVIYTGIRQFLDHRLVLTEEVKQFVLTEGEHTYRFEYVIPTDIPANYDGTFGYIEYHIRAFVDIPWAYDYECRVPFTVIPLLDLNMVKPAQNPLYFEQQKIFGIWCCASGYIRVLVTAPKSGFICLEIVPLIIHIENYSSVKVHRTEIEVRKYVKYLAQTNDRNIKDDNATRHEGFTLLKDKMETKVGANKGIKNFVLFLPLVSTESTTLDSEAIIQFTYEVHVRCKFGGLHKTIAGSGPIFIGTIPIISPGTNFQKLPEKSPPVETPTPIKSQPVEETIKQPQEEYRLPLTELETIWEESLKDTDSQRTSTEAPSNKNPRATPSTVRFSNKQISSTEALRLLDDMISDEKNISDSKFSIRKQAVTENAQGTSAEIPKKRLIKPNLSREPSEEELPTGKSKLGKSKRNSIK